MLTLKTFFRGTYESPQMVASILDNLYAAGDVVIKINGSECCLHLLRHWAIYGM